MVLLHEKESYCAFRNISDRITYREMRFRFPIQDDPEIGVGLRDEGKPKPEAIPSHRLGRRQFRIVLRYENARMGDGCLTGIIHDGFPGRPER
jgi:hypothetical protein